MNRFNVLLTSCAVLFVTTGCEKKKSGEKPVPTQEVQDATKQKPAEPVTQPAESHKESLAEAATQAAAPTETPSGEKIAASFKDGSFIAQNEVLKRIQQLNERVQTLPFTQLYNLVLFVMIQEHLGSTLAVKDGLDKDPKLVRELDIVRRAFLRKKLTDDMTEGKVTPEAVKKQYNELMASFKEEDELGLRCILVKDEAMAKDVVQQIKKGGDFDTLQAKYMINKKMLQNKGNLGYFRKASLPSENADLIMTTPVGSVVSEPVNIPGTGVAVLFVTDKRKTKPTPLEKAEARIRDILQQRFALECINGLLFKHNVTMYSPTGEVIPIKTIDERLEEVRVKQKQEGDEPTEEEKKNEDSVNKLTEKHVVAKYDGDKKVTFAQISDFIKENPSIFRGLSMYEVYVAAIEEYLNAQFIKEEVEQRKIADDAEVQKQIVGTTRALIAQAYWAKAALALLTDAEVRKHFDTIVSKLDPNEMEVRLRVIPVKTKEQGEKVIKELRAGKTFEKALEEYANGSAYKENKGDLGYLRKQQLIQLSSKLQETTFKAAKATTLPEVMDVNGQLLVVRVEDKKRIEMPTFAQSKEFLRQRLQQEYVVLATIEAIQKAGVLAWDFNGKPIDLSKKEEVQKQLSGASTAMANGAA